MTNSVGFWLGPILVMLLVAPGLLVAILASQLGRTLEALDRGEIPSRFLGHWPLVGIAFILLFLGFPVGGLIFPNLDVPAYLKWLQNPPLLMGVMAVLGLASVILIVRLYRIQNSLLRCKPALLGYRRLPLVLRCMLIVGAGICFVYTGLLSPADRVPWHIGTTIVLFAAAMRINPQATYLKNWKPMPFLPGMKAEMITWDWLEQTPMDSAMRQIIEKTGRKVPGTYALYRVATPRPTPQNPSIVDGWEELGWRWRNQALNTGLNKMGVNQVRLMLWEPDMLIANHALIWGHNHYALHCRLKTRSALGVRFFQFLEFHPMIAVILVILGILFMAVGIVAFIARYGGGQFVSTVLPLLFLIPLLINWYLERRSAASLENAYRLWHQAVDHPEDPRSRESVLDFLLQLAALRTIRRGSQNPDIGPLFLRSDRHVAGFLHRMGVSVEILEEEALAIRSYVADCLGYIAGNEDRSDFKPATSNLDCLIRIREAVRSDRWSARRYPGGQAPVRR